MYERLLRVVVRRDKCSSNSSRAKDAWPMVLKLSSDGVISTVLSACQVAFVGSHDEDIRLTRNGSKSIVMNCDGGLSKEFRQILYFR